MDRCRRADVLRPEPHRHVPAGRQICRSDRERSQADRSAGRATDQVRVGDQSQYRQDARSNDPTSDPRPRRRGHRVTRWAVCLLAIAVSATASLSSTAQEPKKVFRIGVLSPAERSTTKIFDAFREGLRDHGYVDGQNITIEYQLAAGDTSRLPEMAGELVR